MIDYFKMPTRIISGIDSLNEIQHLTLHSVLIVCDPFMVTNGTVAHLESLLAEKQIISQVFSKVIPDPTVDVVAAGLVDTLNSQPDGIIALGGGSAIDSAKVIRYVYTLVEKEKSVSLICVPTTSGTGSEVTSFAVISDPNNQSKYALVDNRMVPDIAILDPKLTMTVPKSVTADTGIDVFAHCIEALASTKATDFTDAYAEKAIKTLWQELPVAFKNGDDIKARGKLHNASCLAGIAFSEASLGICHSLAHALGGRFHIPHGRAIGLLLPEVIRYNAGLELNKNLPSLVVYQRIANILGFQAGTPKSTVHSMISGLNRRLTSLEMPQSIVDCQIDPTEFMSAIPEMAAMAMNDKCTITNPRIPEQIDLEQIYRRILKGGR